MEFDIDLQVQYYQGNTKEADKRNYFSNISEKTQRDAYFYYDNSDEYSYGDTKWK